MMLHGGKQVRVPTVCFHLDKTRSLVESKSVAQGPCGGGFGDGFLSLQYLGTVTLVDGEFRRIYLR